MSSESSDVSVFKILDPSSMFNNFPLIPGTLIGPFPAKRVQTNDLEGPRCQLPDVHGDQVDFLLMNDESSFLCRLKVAESIQTSNCTIFEKDSNLYLYVTKIIESLEKMEALFLPIPIHDNRLQEDAPRATAKIINSTPIHDHPLFSSSTTTKTDNMPKLPTDTLTTPFDTSTTSNLHSFVDLRFCGQNPILLPVAFHTMDENFVQVVGPPQVIIPVAIHRDSNVICNPLVVNSLLVQNLVDKATSVKVESNLSEHHEFSLPVAVIDPTKIPNTSDNQSRASFSESTSNRKRKAISLDSKPLDLSVKSEVEPETELEKHLTPTSITTEGHEKPYLCECGVSFTAFTTLIGHQKYYCRNLPHNSEETLRTPQPKIPPQCPQCNFRPTSTSQLTHHMRSNHKSVQAYICLLCAYKGYSIRGVKSHLKNVHSDEIEGNIEASFNKYVFPMTSESKLFPCEKCSLSFPTKELVKRHLCAEKSAIDN